MKVFKGQNNLGCIKPRMRFAEKKNTTYYQFFQLTKIYFRSVKQKKKLQATNLNRPIFLK